VTNQTISTLAFVAGAGMIALYIFHAISIKHALLIGGGLVAIGFITQPAVAT
jgi:hypothetical protein